MTKFKTIRQTVTLGATPQKVYEAYVDPGKHAAFTGSKAMGTSRVGGRFTSWDGYISGKWLVLEKGRRIVHEWTTTEWPEGHPPSKVVLTFAQKGSKTLLRMVHSGVPAEQAGNYADGWMEFYWEPMKKYFLKG